MTDITYIRTAQGWLYLCVVLDLYSKRVVGWSMSDIQDRQMVLKAVLMALWQRPGKATVVLHSDRGTQFTSSQYQQFLLGHNLVCSMNAVGHCGDNAAAEGFFGVLKRERVNRRHYQTMAQARSDVFDYIERFHNPRMQPRLDSRDQKFIALTQLSAKTGYNPLYLAVILDLFSRRVIGWAVKPTIHRELVLEAVMKAVRGRRPRKTLIHSDQGTQYGSDAWRRFCKANHLEPSMSRRANCWDNAVAESFFSSVKKERIKKRIYADRETATLDVSEYIEGFYNLTRRHSYLGGVSPIEFEAAHRRRRLGVH